MKIDLEFEDADKPVYTSLILRAEHPLLQEIIVAYQKLILWAEGDDKQNYTCFSFNQPTDV